MTTTVEPQEPQIPGTVFTPRQVRLLKITVVALGVLILAALAAVVIGMVQVASSMKAKKAAGPAPAVAASQESSAQGRALQGAPFVLPEGTQISSMALDGDRLALHIVTPKGAEIVLIDIMTGRVLSRVKAFAE